ncbi:hypothetical protein QWJ46_18260 [Rhizobium sp. CBN3]|uniref:hypothetical protein n=1 Tax=Rhizobium sp. CBN3 TaxID=3058045 RepID=UPI0026737EC5|nr:hypothetical protein [Rhizobium sp. CBN3]MDO3434621.1 hypothetical protein [Rhizobium sp. CBN3]
MNFDAVLAIMVLMLLGMLFFGPWQELCTAYARQIAFECRDRIFDLAADGKLDFRSQEYRVIRSSMEKLIRFAHDMTLLNFIYITWHLRRKRATTSESHLTTALESIKDLETKAKIRACVERAHFAMFLMMVAKSPLTFWFAFVFVFSRKLGSQLPSRSRSFANPWGEVLQVEAENARVNKGNMKAVA